MQLAKLHANIRFMMGSLRVMPSSSATSWYLTCLTGVFDLGETRAAVVERVAWGPWPWWRGSVSSMDLRRFVEDQLYIASELSSNYRAAASVRLHHAGYTSPVIWRVTSSRASGVLDCTWHASTDEQLRSYANDRECTDLAANAIVLCGALAHLGLLAAVRCETGTGADWFVVPRNAPPPDPVHLDLDRDDLIRLEISGIANDDDRTMNRRLVEKLAQARRPLHPVPAMVGVAGFASLRLEFRTA